jgi:3-hydroxyacyl-CoA dehydrogenase/enoyl-CoA hydratase/3-hydroxybutyryl-CoA epimerase
MVNIKLSKIVDRVATLTFDCEKMKLNILSSEVLVEFEQILEKLNSNHSVDYLIITSAKKTNFIAGADINEIKDITNKKTALRKVKKGQYIFNVLAKLPFRTICYINGSCMGGGTELALACDYRVANTNAKTTIALPEVNLGIIPGFGGTQRLPRLVGVVNSLPLILTGKALDAKKAFKIGLIDHYFPEGYEEMQLKSFLDRVKNNEKQIIKQRKKKRHTLDLFPFLYPIIFNKTKKAILAKTKGLYPAPFAKKG